MTRTSHPAVDGSSTRADPSSRAIGTTSPLVEIEVLSAVSEVLLAQPDLAGEALADLVFEVPVGRGDDADVDVNVGRAADARAGFPEDLTPAVDSLQLSAMQGRVYHPPQESRLRR